jgi:hypothetical protein
MTLARTGLYSTLLLLPLFVACGLPSPEDLWRATEPADKRDLGYDKETVNLLAAHCAAWSGDAPLEVSAEAQVEDFGPSTGDWVRLSLDFGDGYVHREKRPRPLSPGGRPTKYRMGLERTHRYNTAGTYSITATVTNGSRVATCAMAVHVLPDGARMEHPQG